MEQKNKKDSTGIQIETFNAGISIEDIKIIVNGLFYDNFIKLKEEAKEIMNQRLLEFSEKLYDKLKYSNITSLSNPDTQYSLYKASESYVRTSSENKHELLINMIADKVKIEDESNYTLMLNQAIELISKLSNKHINILSFAVVLKNLKLGSLVNIKLPRDERNFKIIFNKILSFIENQDITEKDIRYLSNYSIGTFLLGSNLDEVFINHYPNMFTVEKNNDGKFTKLNEKIYIIINDKKVGLREYVESLDSRFRKVFFVFDDLYLNSLDISPVAEIIGLLNYSINMDDQINFKSWY